MNIDIRYCKKCKQAYDIGIEYDECKKCRKELNEVKGDGQSNK